MGEPKREVRSKWSSLILEQSGSGQTIVAFCRERGLTTSQFYTWRKRLRGSAAEQFLEVQVAKPAARPILSKREAIEIRLAEGRSVRVEPGFDPDHLRVVVTALEMGEVDQPAEFALATPKFFGLREESLGKSMA